MIIRILWSLAVVVALSEALTAAERIEFQAQHICVSTLFDTTLVSDEAGHMLAKFKASGVGLRREGPDEPPYKIEIWGVGDYHADGTGSDLGYGKFIFADGSSYYEKWSSEVKDGRAVGRAVYYAGTGRFEGMEDHSTFDCALMDDRFVCEVDGVLELP